MHLNIKTKTSATKGCVKVFPLIAAGLLSAGFALHAQDNAKVNEVTTAVPLLRISPDARAAALGETSLATSADAASGMLNAAKSVFAEDQSAFMLDYAPWLREITSGNYLFSFAGYRKLDDRQAVNGSLRYFSSGKVEERDYDNNLMQLLTPNELSLDAGYSRKLSEKISVGVTFRYVYSSIGKTVTNTSSGSGSAFAADLSAYYSGLDEEGKGLTAGLIIANVGTGKMNYGSSENNGGFLPARIGAGLGYTLPLVNEDKLTFSGEFNKSLVPLMPGGTEGFNEFKNYGVIESYGKGLGNGALSLSAGAEYMYQELLAIRAGYFTETEAYGGRSYLTAGVGVFYQKMGLNFAYIIPSGSGTERNALSNTLRLGVCFYPGR